MPRWHAITNIEQQPVSCGVQNAPHLIGKGRTATRSVGSELSLVLLDQILRLATRTVEGCKMYSASPFVSEVTT